jgi:UDP-glucose 4-epimerase
MRVLVTGSSGQIGTNLALRLRAQGHEVFGVDKRLNTWTDEFRYLLQDLSGHYPSYPSGIGGVDYPPVDVVVHLAAHAKVHQLVRQPHRAMENMAMTFNVLEYCRQNHLPIVFSSSREVYGDIQRFTTAEAQADFAFTESTYSASKIASEAMIYSYARCYGLRYMVFRFSNVYGRFDSDIVRMERVIPLFISRIKRDEPITIYGPEKVLDFTYVDDCVEGIICGMERLADGSVQDQTINLAYGKGNTLVRMAELIGQALGLQPRITLAPPLLGEVTHYVANIEKARDLLGYVPRVSLEEGIPRAVEWNVEWESGHPQEASASNTATWPAAQDDGSTEGGLPLRYKYEPGSDPLSQTNKG